MYHKQRSRSHSFEGEGTNIKPVETGKENIKLLGKVQINENNKRYLLGIFYSFNQEVSLSGEKSTYDSKE